MKLEQLIGEATEYDKKVMLEVVCLFSVLLMMTLW